jgi:hypothetical protein
VATDNMAATEAASTAGETTMADEATAITTAKAATVSTTEATGVASAVLCPHGHT